MSPDSAAQPPPEHSPEHSPEHLPPQVGGGRQWTGMLAWWKRRTLRLRRDLFQKGGDDIGILLRMQNRWGMPTLRKDVQRSTGKGRAKGA